MHISVHKCFYFNLGDGEGPVFIIPPPCIQQGGHTYPSPSVCDGPIVSLSVLHFWDLSPGYRPLLHSEMFLRWLPLHFQQLQLYPDFTCCQGSPESLVGQRSPKLDLISMASQHLSFTHRKEGPAEAEQVQITQRVFTHSSQGLSLAFSFQRVGQIWSFVQEKKTPTLMSMQSISRGGAYNRWNYTSVVKDWKVSDPMGF